MLRIGNFYVRLTDVERVMVNHDGTLHVVVHGHTGHLVETSAVGDIAAANRLAASIMRRASAVPSAPARPPLPERLAARTATPARPVQHTTRRAATANPSATARSSAFGPTHFRDSAARMANTAREAQRNVAAAIGGSMLAGMD